MFSFLEILLHLYVKEKYVVDSYLLTSRPLVAHELDECLTWLQSLCLFPLSI